MGPCSSQSVVSGAVKSSGLGRPLLGFFAFSGLDSCMVHDELSSFQGRIPSCY